MGVYLPFVHKCCFGFHFRFVALCFLLLQILSFKESVVMKFVRPFKTVKVLTYSKRYSCILYYKKLNNSNKLVLVDLEATVSMRIVWSKRSTTNPFRCSSIYRQHTCLIVFLKKDKISSNLECLNIIISSLESCNDHTLLSNSRWETAIPLAGFVKAWTLLKLY